jgi:hypothetical protein
MEFDFRAASSILDALLGSQLTSTTKCVAVPVSELNASSEMIKKLAVRWPFQCDRVCLVELRPGRAPLNLVAAEQLTDTRPIEGWYPSQMLSIFRP